jgi:hypothetical protein
MKLALIGDIHGKWMRYASVLSQLDCDATLQIGDFGWGFPNFEPHRIENVEAAMIAGDNMYFRGNHDNPAECKAHEFCIPDVTYDFYPGVFTLAGAFSIDYGRRTLGVDYWPDEELSYVQFSAAIDLYDAKRPDIVISHDAPESAAHELFHWYHKDYPSATRDALEAMRAIHKPILDTDTLEVEHVNLL